MGSFSSKVRTATALLKGQADAAFARTGNEADLKAIWAAGYTDAYLQHDPIIADPTMSRNAAAYCEGYRVGAGARTCPQCGATNRQDGTCEFCEGVCDTCAAPTESDGTCVNPDCETRAVSA